MAGVVDLEIPPRRDHFAVVRLVVTAAATVDGRLPERRVDDLRLAVSEACANAVDAMQSSGGDLPIRISVSLGDDGVSVTITDHAGGFDPDEVASLPGATEPERLRHERGLGIPLMRSLVDDVRFDRTADGTSVRLSVGPAPRA